MTNTVTFDPVAFRQAFPQFANTTCFTDGQLSMWFDLATAYISAEDCSCYMLTGPARVQALNLLTAQMGFLFDLASKGETPAVMKSATIDKVSVTVEPPPSDSAFQWWLGLSPYGQTLLGLLSMLGAGGFYVGGLPERAAFRRVGGGFGGLRVPGCG